MVSSEFLYLLSLLHRQGVRKGEVRHMPKHEPPDNELPEEDEVDVQLPTRLKAIESALLTLATAKTEAADGTGPSTEVCRLYNNNKCRYKKCKYRHACAVCNGPHPAVWCQKLRPSSEQNRQFRREAARPY